MGRPRRAHRGSRRLRRRRRRRRRPPGLPARWTACPRTTCPRANGGHRMRSRLLLAAAVVVNLAGVGSLVWRAAGEQPVVVSTAGVGAGQPGRSAPALAGTPRGDGTVFAKYDVADDGAKVFRLDAAPYTWEVSPGVTKQAFAFNGTVPGPTIRVIEGDKVRIIVTNHLPTGTAVHWHGMVLPNKQDGV